MKNIFYILLSLFVFVSCAADSGLDSSYLESDSSTQEGREINFSINNLTRSLDLKEAWDYGDTVAIFVKPNAADDTAYGSPYCYTVAIGEPMYGTLLYVETPIYDTGEELDFCAFYPWDGDLTTYAEYQARSNVDLATQDYMCSEASLNDGSAVFAFSHIYSMLTFNFTAAGDYNSGDGFDITLSFDDGSEDIDFPICAGISTDIFVSPRSLDDGDITIKSTTDEGIYSYTFAQALASVSQWEGGKYYLYDNLQIGEGTIEGSYLEFRREYSNTKNITKVDTEGHIASILSKFRRCLAKSDGSGNMTIAYLLDSNSNYYADGSAADLTGGAGDVMVYFPAHWYKYENLNDTFFRFHISENEIVGGIYVPASLVGAYKGAYSTDADSSSDKIVSYSDRTLISGASYINCYAKAAARGTGYQMIDYSQHCTIAMMLYAKYEDRNIPLYLGTGNAQTITSTSNGGEKYSTGQSNSLGNVDTDAVMSGYVCGLGLEGVYGGAVEWVQGISISSATSTITNPDGTTQTVKSPTSGSYITKIAAEEADSYGGYFHMLPLEASGGSSTTYYDGSYSYSSSGIYMKRSSSGFDTSCGVAYICFSASASYTYTGPRLAFRGTITEATSVTAFKSMTFNE